jgi:TRAP-type C4-dicarboxylate transport system permease small subunit
MKFVRNVSRGITGGVFTVAAVLLGFSAALAFFNAVGRGFFSFNFSGSEELSTYAVVIAVFFAIPYLELHDEQLSVNILSMVIKNKTVLKIMFFLRAVLTLLILFILVKYGIAAAQSAFVAGTETYALRWPKYLFFSVAVAGAAMGILSWLTIIFFNKGEKL